MISDCGMQFVAEFTRKLYCLLRIKITVSTAYHPQTDGQTEHVERGILGLMRANAYDLSHTHTNNTHTHTH